MKNLLALFVISLLSTLTTQAQSQVTYQKGFGGYKFFQDGKLLTPRAMANLYNDVPQAATLMYKAKSSFNFSMVLGYAGGFLVGYPLGTAIGGGNPEWSLLGVGAGLIVLAIPVSKSFTKNAIKATDIYNNNVMAEATSFKINLGATKHGYGLCFSF